METAQYESIIRLLNKELVPALGCTEPIAIAYAAAALKRARLGKHRKRWKQPAAATSLRTYRA